MSEYAYRRRWDPRGSENCFTKGFGETKGPGTGKRCSEVVIPIPITLSFSDERTLCPGRPRELILRNERYTYPTINLFVTP